jgi:hypothetical protein
MNRGCLTSQDADAEVRQVHGATFAFTQASAFAKELRHGPLHLPTLGNRMAVRAVVASHIVVVPQSQAGSHSDGFLADVGVGRPDNLAAFDQPYNLLLKAADEQHAPQHFHQQRFI